MICNYSNISVRNNQDFFKDYLNIAFWLKGSMPAWFEPEPLYHVFTELRLAILQEILKYIGIHKQAHPSHETIAKKVGCSRNAVLDALKLFENMGLLKVTHRHKEYKSNIYELGEVLKFPAVRWALRNSMSNLSYAFHAMKDRLAQEVQAKIQEGKKLLNALLTTVKRQDSTLLLNNNVLKELNTNQVDYKDIKLYRSPYIKNKDLYHNMKKALWADWSMNEDDYRRSLKMLEEDLLFDFDAQEEIIKDRKYQQFKRNDAKYPDYYKDMHEYHKKNGNEFKVPEKPVDNITRISAQVMNERLSLCNQEPNLDRRLLMLERLRKQVERASIPFIDFQIKKTRSKLCM